MDQEQYLKLDPTTQQWLPIEPPKRGMTGGQVAGIAGGCSLIALLLGALLGVTIAPAKKTNVAATSPTSTAPAIRPSTTSTTAEATTTTEPASTSTIRSTAALTAALLSAADVPGAKSSPPTADSVDLSACFPGNPLGAKTSPNEVRGPELQLTDGALVRDYSSSATQGTPKQAADFVATFASPTGSKCVLDAFKTSITNDPKPPKLDASGLNGTVTTATVGDRGAVLPLTGDLISDGKTVPAGVDLLAFHRGAVVVTIAVVTFGGPNRPSDAVGLATKVDDRLR